ERHIRPLLATHCLSCHGPTAQKSGLRLDTREGFLRGGERGAIVVAGQPQKISANEIAVLEKWIALGHPWPEKATILAVDKVAEAAAKHWAFQPIARP